MKHFYLGHLHIVAGRQTNYRRTHWRIGFLYAWACWRGRLIGADWR